MYVCMCVCVYICVNNCKTIVVYLIFTVSKSLYDKLLLLIRYFFFIFCCHGCCSAFLSFSLQLSFSSYYYFLFFFFANIRFPIQIKKTNEMLEKLFPSYGCCCCSCHNFNVEGKLLSVFRYSLHSVYICACDFCSFRFYLFRKYCRTFSFFD